MEGQGFIYLFILNPAYWYMFCIANSLEMYPPTKLKVKIHLHLVPGYVVSLSCVMHLPNTSCHTISEHSIISVQKTSKLKLTEQDKPVLKTL